MADELIQFERALPTIRGRDGKPVYIVVVLDKQGVPHTPVNGLCDALWLTDKKQQRDRLQQHAVLSRMVQTLVVKTRGGRQQTLCLNCRAIGFYFGMINTEQVNPAVRDQIISLQWQIMELAEQLLNGVVDERPALGSSQALANSYQGQSYDQWFRTIAGFLQMLHLRVSDLERLQGPSEYTDKTD